MRALVLRADANMHNPCLRWDDVPLPALRAGEVLIRVLACGVCGTDAHCVQSDESGRIRYSGALHLPVILGHEFAGIVTEVHHDVSTLEPGELVTCEGMIGCGACRSCCGGLPNQCAQLRMVGLSCPGAFAECIALHERYCWSLDRLREQTGDQVRAAEMGALVEPLACSFNGIFVQDGSFRPGNHVVIFGAGPIGLGAVALTRLAGASTITVFEIVEARRKLAKKMGADIALAPDVSGTSVRDVVMESTKGHGADLEIDAAGVSSVLMSQIEESLAPGGRLLYLARTGEKGVLSWDRIVTGSNHLIGSRGHVGGECFPRIIGLLESGRLNVSSMITRRLPMTQAIHAINEAGRLRDGKVMTYWE